MFLRNILKQLYSDVAYDTVCYTSAPGVSNEGAMEFEMGMLLLIIKNSTPTQIINARKIDRELLMLIAYVTNHDVRDIENYGTNGKIIRKNSTIPKTHHSI